MKIRTATVMDAREIADIHASSWRNTYRSVLSERYLNDIVPGERDEIWRERLNNPKLNQYVVVAENADGLVGFACAYAGENPVWGSYLDNLHVRQAFHSKGIGKALLLKAAGYCYQSEPDKGLCLLVNMTNIKAQEFYMAFGARNAQPGVWNAPDGSVVPTYWFVWDKVEDLVKMANYQR